MFYFKKIEFKDNMQRSERYKSYGEKRLFLFYGGLNFLITNVILQINLLIMPIIFATIISQLINLILGYYFYGKKVFKLNYLSNLVFKKYSLLAFSLWILNFSLIKSLNYLGINKNLSAFYVIPLLVLISYLVQKVYVFKKK